MPKAEFLLFRMYCCILKSAKYNQVFLVEKVKHIFSFSERQNYPVEHKNSAKRSPWPRCNDTPRHQPVYLIPLYIVKRK